MICKYGFSYERRTAALLSFSWLIGSLVGFVFAIVCKNSDVCLAFSNVYMTNVFTRLLLFLSPLIITLILHIISFRFLIYFIAAGKAFLYLFGASFVLLSFSSNGWLFRFFLFFADSVSVICLLWLWLRILTKGFRKKEFLITFLIVFSAFVMDNCYISPYFLRILSL